MLAVIGAVLAQLFALQRDSGFGYFAIGKPLAIACFALAIITVLLGASRNLQYQHALVNGTALIGGTEPAIIGASILVVSLNRVTWPTVSPAW